MMMGWRPHHHGLIIRATTLVNKPMRRSPGATGASRSLARSDRLLAKPIPPDMLIVRRSQSFPRPKGKGR